MAPITVAEAWEELGLKEGTPLEEARREDAAAAELRRTHA